MPARLLQLSHSDSPPVHPSQLLPGAVLQRRAAPVLQPPLMVRAAAPVTATARVVQQPQGPLGSPAASVASA